MNLQLLLVLSPYLLLQVTSVAFPLLKNQTRTLRWTIVPKQDLIIESYFKLAFNHTLTITIKVEDKVLFGSTFYTSDQLKKTIPNPFYSVEGKPPHQFYLITVECNSSNSQREQLWNFVHIKVSSDFKNVLSHNTHREYTRKTKQKRKQILKIQEFSEGIASLAKEHQELQMKVREEENEVEKRISATTGTLAYLVILEIIVISVCALLQVLSFRSYLINKHLC